LSLLLDLLLDLLNVHIWQLKILATLSVSDRLSISLKQEYCLSLGLYAY